MTGIVGAINAAQRAKNRYRDSDPARLALRGAASVVGADRPRRRRIGSDRGSGDGAITVWRPVAFPML